MKPKLSPKMSLEQFDNGYWYAVELKAFAKQLGLPSASRLRKDELEAAIKHFLRTGELTPAPAAVAPRRGDCDSSRGLRLDLPVVVYKNDPATKQFLESEAAKLAPGMKRRSGARYRLNRWRERELAKGRKLLYGDLVREYARLNQSEEPFEQVPHGRYINFVSDFFKDRPETTQAEVTEAWKQLKQLDLPKTYAAWKQRRGSRSRAKKKRPGRPGR